LEHLEADLVQYAVIERLGEVWSWQVVLRLGDDFSDDGEALAKEMEYQRFAHSHNI
jgi:hypothetical protein